MESKIVLSKVNEAISERNLSKIDQVPVVDFDHDRDPSRSWPYTIGLNRQVKPRNWKDRTSFITRLNDLDPDHVRSCAILRDHTRSCAMQRIWFY